MKVIIPKGRKTPSGREEISAKRLPPGKGVMLPCTAFVIAMAFSRIVLLAGAVFPNKPTVEEFEEYRRIR